eukprot:TRINITY_DN12009_c0_g1_i1.p2 TRINITY_DN12009_c0_g1~~TRINITY_DN12009_c0_g1_i1.p2  ORF type:complete len:234 (+),score=20.98 TRINITY_DN12009_c0_g1_i1:41-742(+)
MPLPKPPPTNPPSWKSWEQKAKRNGTLGAITMPNGDVYKGEWKDDLVHGKGKYTSKENGYCYEGGFEQGLRHGYGVYSIVKPDGTRFKRYLGGWARGQQHGKGTYFYTEDSEERYEGEWCDGQRSGWGRMRYKDGSVYEGEWLDDARHGLGLLLQANEDRYEGSWANDRKHGDGTFFYIAKNKCYKGTWHEGTPKCGEFFTLDEAASQGTCIPQLKLANAAGVLDSAKQTIVS